MSPAGIDKILWALQLAVVTAALVTGVHHRWWAVGALIGCYAVLASIRLAHALHSGRTH